MGLALTTGHGNSNLARIRRSRDCSRYTLLHTRYWRFIVFRITAALVALALPAFAFALPLQTVAEKSNYKATSTGADVIQFCEAVAKRGPVARLDHFGTSHEGRKLPLLVIANPPVATPEDAKNSGKLVVLAFANIHAGEVDGKEALLAFARDLSKKQKQDTATGIY